MTGIEFITAERTRQVERIGYDEEHDRHHTDEELARAGAWYALPDYLRKPIATWLKVVVWPAGWDFNRAPDGDNEARIWELTKAGALIAAEIDRLQAQS